VVTIELLGRAVRLVSDLGDLDDPAGFPGVALPALAGLVDCDRLTYHEVSDARWSVVYHDFPGRPSGRTEFARFVLMMNMSDGRTCYASFAFHRSTRDFSEYERELLGALREPLCTELVRCRARWRSRQALTEPGTPAGLATLTSREIHVLELVAGGGTNTAIARTLGVSPRTVAKHLEHAYRKLDVANRAAAIARLR
jgi:DNA-binding CsgD family transcriptional regulator